MLTDTKLRNLKPKSKLYKASDRDGMNRPGFPRHSPSSGNSAFQTPLAIAA